MANHGYVEGYGAQGDIYDDRENDRERSEWFGGRERPRDEDRETIGRWRDDDEPADRFGYGEFEGTLGGFGNQQVGISERDQYLDWRQRQMDALDRDYRDYCREREQQFHSDFDSWRQGRRAPADMSAEDAALEEPLDLGDPASAKALDPAAAPATGRARR